MQNIAQIGTQHPHTPLLTFYGDKVNEKANLKWSQPLK